MLNYFKAITVIFLLFVTSFSYGQDFDLPPGVKTIVIDPGHGGHDQGCSGAHTKEKHVALAIGLKLGKFIKEKYPEVNVIYTRDKDVFVTLDGRAKIANEANADLFICIHANSASSSAYGVETFVLGLHRTETQQKIAERENSTIHLEDDGGEKYKDFDMSPDALIARQLQLSYFLDQSISFADKIQSEFKQLGRRDRGVKQAGFIVLYKTTMPSVLIETGFLTNKEEEKFLKNPANQAKMANGIFKAFQLYKAEIEGVNTLVVDAVGLDKDTSVTEKEEFVELINEDDIVFKVQIDTSPTEVSLNDVRFKGQSVAQYYQGGLYKYTVGTFVNSFNKANILRKEMVTKGYKHAFVVAFKNGKRMNLNQALKEIKDQ